MAASTQLAMWSCGRQYSMLAVGAFLSYVYLVNINTIIMPILGEIGTTANSESLCIFCDAVPDASVLDAIHVS